MSTIQNIFFKYKKAFSLVELQISLIILTAGTIGLTSILNTHSRQLERIESRFDAENYFFVTQENSWMQRLGASALVSNEPGNEAWTPQVTGEDVYKLAIDYLNMNMDSRTIDIIVNLEEIED